MTEDPEITALTSVYTALKDLDPEAQQRVLDYVARKLGLQHGPAAERLKDPAGLTEDLPRSEPVSDTRNQIEEGSISDTEGISPVALKWMRRNGLKVEDLGRLFSIGADEIDLIAKSVPGNSKNSRARSVALLKGMATYLSTGAARITYEQIKEACLHYDAYDASNHARTLKGMAAELSGSTSGGFVLTARGLTAGTELIKEVLGITANS